METTEIRMITDLDKALPQSIAFNFEEVKTWLTENLASYKSMVVTEDEIGAAKADKAKISKLSKTISEPGEILQDVRGTANPDCLRHGKNRRRSQQPAQN